jgi:hypothetical protein
MCFVSYVRRIAILFSVVLRLILQLFHFFLFLTLLSVRYLFGVYASLLSCSFSSLPIFAVLILWIIDVIVSYFSQYFLVFFADYFVFLPNWLFQSSFFPLYLYALLWIGIDSGLKFPF